MSLQDRGGPWRERQGQAYSILNRPSHQAQPGQKVLPQVPSSNPYHQTHNQATSQSKTITSARITNVHEDEEQTNLSESNQQNIETEFPQNPLEKEKPLSPVTPPQTVPESELNVALVRTSEAEQNLAESRLECEKLRKKVTELSKLLEDAQDFIFRLQPYQQKITESDATAAFASLCKSVESWVEFRLGNAIEDRIIFKESVFESRSATDLLNLVGPAGNEAFLCPETDEPNVIAAVMQFLMNEIFEKDFYCPIDLSGMEFLDSIEKSMRTLVPHRDIATIRSWRSETLNALANRPDFDSRRADRIKQLTTSLAQMLRIFIPRAERKEVQSSIKTSIVERAVELAHRLQLSVDKFEVKWTPYSKGYSTHGGHCIPDAYQFECVNLLAGGKIIKFPADEKTFQREHITYILDICPGLYCRSVKSDGYLASKVLKKPKVLVAMTMPDEPPFQARPPNEANVTLLGSICNQLQPKQRRMGFG